jgi:DNA polymerase
MRWSERQRAMLRELAVPMPPGPRAAPIPPGPRAGAIPAAPEAARRPAPSAPAARPPLPAPASAPVSKPAAAPPTDAARAARIAAMGWPALRTEVAGCTACALCRTRRQTVFGVGAERARWMVVGEAPGEQEDARGEPFVGAAGQLLDRMLAALDLARAAGAGSEEAADRAAAPQPVFIANTLKCRPPGNRNPAPEELAACQPFLERQIELVAPRVILALGRFAAQALLGSTEPIGRLRGRVHRWRSTPVVVSYHPSYLLRSPAEKGKAWEDLCLAARVHDEGGAAGG